MENKQASSLPNYVIFPGLLVNFKPAPLTLNQILSRISSSLNISEELIKSKCRDSEITFARQVICYIATRICVPSYTLKNVGIFLNIDHSTVHYSLRMISDNVETNQRRSGIIVNELLAEFKIHEKQKQR